MKYIDPTRDQFKSIATSNIEGKLSMLNLLKFKEKVGDLSGAEQYKLYMAAANPFFEKVNEDAANINNVKIISDYSVEEVMLIL